MSGQKPKQPDIQTTGREGAAMQPSLPIVRSKPRLVLATLALVLFKSWLLAVTSHSYLFSSWSYDQWLNERAFFSIAVSALFVLVGTTQPLQRFFSYENRWAFFALAGVGTIMIATLPLLPLPSIANTLWFVTALAVCALGYVGCVFLLYLFIVAVGSLFWQVVLTLGSLVLSAAVIPALTLVEPLAQIALTALFPLSLALSFFAAGFKGVDRLDAKDAPAPFARANWQRWVRLLCFAVGAGLIKSAGPASFLAATSASTGAPDPVFVTVSLLYTVLVIQATKDGAIGVLPAVGISLATWNITALITLGFVNVGEEVADGIVIVAICLALFTLVPQNAPRAATEEGGRDGGGDGTESVTAIAEEYRLTPKEAEILLPLSQGRSIPYLAEQLCVTEGTVRTHVYHIYQKLDVHNRQELIDLIRSR